MQVNNCEIIKGEAEDKVQFDKQNQPNRYILKYWKPKTSLEEGIRKIINLYSL